MAEVFGIVGSIVGIATAGTKLTTSLYNFYETVSTADKAIKDIATEVSLTSSVLYQLSKSLEQDVQVRLCSDQALDTAKRVVEECSAVFGEIEIELKKAMKTVKRSPNPSTGQKIIIATKERLRWPFLQPKMELLRTNLDRLKATLSLMLLVLDYARKRPVPISQSNRAHAASQSDSEKCGPDDFERLQMEMLHQKEQQAMKTYKEAQRTIGFESEEKEMHKFDVGDHDIARPGISMSTVRPELEKQINQNGQLKPLVDFILGQRFQLQSQSSTTGISPPSADEVPSGLIILQPGHVKQLFIHYGADGATDRWNDHGNWSFVDEAQYLNFWQIRLRPDLEKLKISGSDHIGCLRQSSVGSQHNVASGTGTTSSPNLPQYSYHSSTKSARRQQGTVNNAAALRAEAGTQIETETDNRVPMPGVPIAELDHDLAAQDSTWFLSDESLDGADRIPTSSEPPIRGDMGLDVHDLQHESTVEPQHASEGYAPSTILAQQHQGLTLYKKFRRYLSKLRYRRSRPDASGPPGTVAMPSTIDEVAEYGLAAPASEMPLVAELPSELPMSHASLGFAGIPRRHARKMAIFPKWFAASNSQQGTESDGSIVQDGSISSTDDVPRPRTPKGEGEPSSIVDKLLSEWTTLEV